jgi:hypothetical protein
MAKKKRAPRRQRYVNMLEDLIEEYGGDIRLSEALALVGRRRPAGHPRDDFLHRLAFVLVLELETKGVNRNRAYRAVAPWFKKSPGAVGKSYKEGQKLFEEANGDLNKDDLVEFHLDCHNLIHRVLAGTKVPPK